MVVFSNITQALKTSLAVAVLGVTWGGFLFTGRLQAQSPAASTDNLKAVTSMVEEVVEHIFNYALQSPTKPAIYQKAWLSLLLEEGRSDLADDYDFSILSTDDAAVQFMQALETLASSPGQRRSLRDLAESALQNYCRQHDAYTRYIRSEEYRHIKLMEKGEGSHVGMSLNEKDGAIFVYPMPDSPAEEAGVKPADRLLTVDGRSVDGRPLQYVASLFKGAPGTEVELKVKHSFGRTGTLKVMRGSMDVPELMMEKKVNGLVLRIRRFNDDMLQEFKKALEELRPNQSLTIDLRGCAGGRFDSAIEFTELFLPQGEPIVNVRMRDGADESYTARKAPLFNPKAIILLQDEGTASAAEMVIAALMNCKALQVTSQGAKTYGKGVMLGLYELKGGGALTITRGELIAPQGRTWDHIGLLSSLENEGKIFPESEVPDAAP